MSRAKVRSSELISVGDPAVGLPDAKSQPSWLVQTSEQIIDGWKQKLESSKTTQEGIPQIRFFFDLDDTLFATAIYWWKFFERYLRRYGKDSSQLEKSRPTKEQVFAVGGPNIFYRNELGDKAFQEFAEKFRQHRGTNIIPDLVSPVIPEMVERSMASMGQIMGGLTARPDTFDVRGSTWKQLQKTGFWQPEWPVLFRPVDSTHEQAFDWKVNLLASFRELAPKELLVLIDDNLETAEKLARWNEQNPDKLHLVQVLYNGDLTQYELDKNAKKWESKPGIFVLNRWEDLPEVLAKIQKWYDQIPKPQVNSAR